MSAASFRFSDYLQSQSRTAIVTGGSSGIGKAIAFGLAEAGVNVVIGSRSATANLCQAEIKAHAGRKVDSLVMHLNVTSTDSVRTFVETVVKAFGKVDILVNSAGIMPEQAICGHPDELWHQIIDVNLNGSYRTIKFCLPQMIERKWGRIINIASTAASVGNAGWGAYCASKAGVVGLTRCVALEGAPHGITCNAISPGWVETEGAKNYLTQVSQTEGRSLAECLEELKQANPQKRIIQPEEIGELAVFLCRDQARGITMQDITLSAGAIW